MRRIAAFIANMISAGGCASAGFAEDGALVPPTSVGGAPPSGSAYIGFKNNTYVMGVQVINEIWIISKLVEIIPVKSIEINLHDVIIRP
jgi:hypothetical protein